MANAKNIVNQNVEGDFFVDQTCISCSNCRDMAPKNFAEAGEYFAVFNQPQNEIQKSQSLDALVCCPVGAIGIRENKKNFDLRKAIEAVPKLIENSDGEVFYLGFNSPDSYGGKSYFVKHEGGNWMIDSPKFTRHLVEWIESQGGLSYIFLTHRDDVAQSGEYAKQFNAKRIIHREDLDAEPESEIVIEGIEARTFDSDFIVIPQPGHTKGHCMLLYKNKFLFSGDVLTADEEGNLTTGKYCWYSWNVQNESLRRLAEYKFSVTLPAHGKRVQTTESLMNSQLTKLVSNW